MANPKLVAVAVMMPDEIDLANAETVCEQLSSAVTAGIDLVFADFRLTNYCDSSGVRAICRARKHATEAGAEIRLVIPPGNVLRVLELMGLDKVLQPYPTMAAALNGEVERSQTG